MNSPTASISQAVDEPPSHRIGDNGRALWMVTVALVVLGYAVLRGLSGSIETPTLNVAPSDTPAPAPLAPAADEQSTSLHSIRPESTTYEPVGFFATDSQESQKPWEPIRETTWDEVLTGNDNPSVAQEPLLRR